MLAQGFFGVKYSHAISAVYSQTNTITCDRQEAVYRTLKRVPEEVLSDLCFLENEILVFVTFLHEHFSCTFIQTQMTSLQYISHIEKNVSKHPSHKEKPSCSVLTLKLFFGVKLKNKEGKKEEKHRKASSRSEKTEIQPIAR